MATTTRIIRRGAAGAVCLLASIVGYLPDSAFAQSTAGAGKLAITVDKSTTWQPRGGEIRFTVAGNPASVPGNLAACLSWKAPTTRTAASPEPDPDCHTLWVRRIAEVKDPPGVVFAVTVPRDFPDNPSDADTFIAGIVPAAYLDVSVPGTGQPEFRKVGITSVWLAAFLSITAVLLAGWMMDRFAVYLGVPGPDYTAPRGIGDTIRLAARGFSVPLRIISTAKGWASLAQLQIMLWTFVIGAGAVYVMSLTGSLIPISTGTLALLGIAGGATILSEVKANQQSQSAPPLVQELRVMGEPLETEILVAWLPPASGTPASSYIVQYEHPSAPNEWHYATSTLPTTSFRIVDLVPNTDYRVRVIARNSAGNSGEAIVKAPTAVAHGTSTPTADVHPRMLGATESAVVLEWNATTRVPPSDFVVQMRPTDTDEGWTEVTEAVKIAGTTVQLVVSNLKPATRYNFRVRMRSQPDAWTSLPPCQTAEHVRTPKWSDIVTDTDRPAEIDVTRVQMLFFTVISAFFVGLKIIDTGTIPDIDNSYVALMGISNGVYITAKFARN